jgi:hypothetical protein
MTDYDEIVEIHAESDIHLENCIMANEIWMKNTLVRYQYVADQEKIKQKCPYLWFTVNPNPNITVHEFISIMNKMMTKPWIVNYLYVYEQRGESEGECGKDYHFHAIIKKPTNKSYAHILRELSSSANRVCDTSVSNFLNLKNISEEEKERKIIYITGRKTDPLKWLKQDMDIIFREKERLLSFYSVGIL